ncbi:L,D-transpeptidase [Algibacter sp. L1A34]|uniref:L,D-transpeptidase n=1 Tax=Algibacter sp. L1A34 TaxID=2686365 RepID=UPI00131B8198|nr:L,D-transpeptidase [Algibacter sp. L1A34]
MIQIKDPTSITFSTAKQKIQLKALGFLFCISFICFTGCANFNKKNTVLDSNTTNNPPIKKESVLKKPVINNKIVVNKDIPIRVYFKWMDSLVTVLNQKNSYPIDEYIIVRFNPWILDTLAHTDYYYLKEKGIFNEDSQALFALVKDQIISIPDSVQTQKIKERMANTYIDVNIPEFKLRIIENGKVSYTFPVRVGQNNKRYLEMAKREVDMRTKPGIGKIVRVNKTPVFINPKDNHKYYATKRDDNKVTKLPAIPWIEPEIDGRRFGQLIHPTTNMATLGKAYSNGCIGLRESDAWFVYYYAPLGTKVFIRYELQGKDDEGENIQFANIYPGFENKTYRKEAIESAFKAIDGKPTTACDCRVLE